MITRDEMERTIQEELTNIPYIKNNLPQNLLRETYHNTRLTNLKVLGTKEYALKLCIDSLKKEHPNWEPVYDKEFFKI
ncbi:MAG: hypothetical protein ACREBJ_03250 [Nitrosotalea sp.]